MDRYSDQLMTHLKENKPQVYRRMVAQGELQAYLKLKSDAAYRQKQSLIESGMPDDMAEEVVIADLFR